MLLASAFPTTSHQTSLSTSCPTVFICAADSPPRFYQLHHFHPCQILFSSTDKYPPIPVTSQTFLPSLRIQPLGDQTAQMATQPPGKFNHSSIVTALVCFHTPGPSQRPWASLGCPWEGFLAAVGHGRGGTMLEFSALGLGKTPWGCH